MRKLGEKMKEKQEQIVMRISFWSGVVFALAELIMAIFSKSQSVLADTVYDSTELVVIGLTIYIIPLFYKPVTEKHPFGYAQLESILILLKGFMFIAVMMVLIMNNVQIMLNGGNEIDHMQVSLFETILTCFSALILLILMRINYGYLHFYFFLCIILGYILCKVVMKKIVKKQ